MDQKIWEMDDRLLLFNLYLTQGITLVLGVLGLYFVHVSKGTTVVSFFGIQPIGSIVGWSLGLAGGIIFVELVSVYYLPKKHFDDGGINEKLFSERPVWHILIIACMVSLSEELLFRAVIQTKIGLFYASVLFALIHIRYLKKWVMFSFVFIVSLALGWLYEHTGTIVAPMICHFVIDFVLAVLIRFKWVPTKEGE